MFRMKRPPKQQQRHAGPGSVSSQLLTQSLLAQLYTMRSKVDELTIYRLHELVLFSGGV